MMAGWAMKHVSIFVLTACVSVVCVMCAKGHTATRSPVQTEPKLHMTTSTISTGWERFHSEGSAETQLQSEKAEKAAHIFNTRISFVPTEKKNLHRTQLSHTEGNCNFRYRSSSLSF